jgi:hypothetical protein
VHAKLQLMPRHWYGWQMLPGYFGVPYFSPIWAERHHSCAGRPALGPSGTSSATVRRGSSRDRRQMSARRRPAASTRIPFFHHTARYRARPQN